MAMTDRKRRVLQALIDDYIMTADPVGSATLAKKYNLGVSSATIRNDLAELEQLGYLDKPHTSSGRIPSDKGYRMYVDELMIRPRISDQVRYYVRGLYRPQVREVQWFIHQTARLVSEMTGYPSAVVAPTVSEAKLQDLHLVPLGTDTVLMVIRTDEGMIENRVVTLPEEFDFSELESLAEEFSQGFRGTMINELYDRILEPLAGDISRFPQLWDSVFQWFSQTADHDDERVTWAGPLNILNYPEFQDVVKVRRVLGFLERETALDQVLAAQPGGGVRITIGTESSVDAIQDCSVVTTTYEVGYRVVGKLIVLGPKRMQYGHVVNILEMVSEELSRALQWV